MQGNREDAKNILIIISDGMSDDGVQSALQVIIACILLSSQETLQIAKKRKQNLKLNSRLKV